MRNWKVGIRLGLAFTLLLALMALSLAVAVNGIRGAEEHASRLERENVALLDAANAMRIAQLDEAVAIRDFVSLADVNAQKAAVQSLKASEHVYADAAKALDQVIAGMQNPELVAQVSRVKQANAAVSKKLLEAMELSESAEYQQAQTLVYNEVRPLQAAIGSALQGLVVRSNTLARERAQAARVQAAQAEQRLLLVALVALLLGVVATWSITRGIVNPLRSAVDAAERVADGNLTTLRVQQGRDETGRVLAALAGMQQRLNALVRSIREGAGRVSHASEQLANGNTELAARTEEQAASLEETAASIEELTASVKQSSDNAGRASSLASRAAALAQEGGQAVGGVVQRMQGIQTSSRKVSDIVGLMDEMAFQTNLLALNAAVEAARAGEQGRGFAVVAAQVRVLAQRSAEASKDIKGLVAEAVAQANQGTDAARAAGDTMDKVVQVVRDVAQVVSEIARATEEQRTGIEQVNGTVAQLEGVTQGNNSLVQEISTLAESLRDQARDLVAASSRFRLEELEQVQDERRTGHAPPLGWSDTQALPA